MRPPDQELRARWGNAVRAVRAVPAVRAVRAEGRCDPAPYADDLLARWSEPWRRYHATGHLVAVLDHVDELAGHTASADVVRLAAWFHDAVYRPDRPDNEELSAALAERVLPELGVEADPTAEVARLVRLTVTHDPAAGDHNGELLCDADLAILGAAPDRYAAYAALVREEYSAVPDDLFRTGRSDVLTRLLARPRLFRTPRGYARWEHAARRNLREELRRLR